MRLPFHAPAFLAVAALLALPLAACGDDDDDLKGPPELQKLLVLAPDQELDLLAPPDGGAPAASAVSTMKAVFNRLLVGTNIEDVEGDRTRPRTDVARLTWTGAPAGAPAITATASYNPGGALGVKIPGPSILIRPQPGLPSGARIELRFERTKIVGKKDGAPYVGAEAFTFETEPFEATVSPKDGEVVMAGVTVSVAFSNLLAAGAAQKIQVTAGGAPFAVEIKQDPMNPRSWAISPAGMTMGWPAGRYTVAVPAEVADPFGVTLGKAVSSSFTVVSGDGGVPAGPDGGAADAAVDGGVDAISAPDGATDGGTDA